MTDFNARLKAEPAEEYYDIHFDSELIEMSIAKQYGILPSQQEQLRYSDWSKLVAGLMEDTPLGRTVALRMESDPEVIKNLSSSQKRARREWTDFCVKKLKQNPKYEETVRAQLSQIQAALKAAFCVSTRGDTQ